MLNRALVLDANILIRAVLGKRVRAILETHADDISFFVPKAAYAEAEEHLPTLINKRGGDPAKALAGLRSIAALGSIIDHEIYAEFQAEARRRLPTSSDVGSPPGSWSRSRSSLITERLPRAHAREPVAGAHFRSPRQRNYAKGPLNPRSTVQPS